MALHVTPSRPRYREFSAGSSRDYWRILRGFTNAAHEFVRGTKSCKKCPNRRARGTKSRHSGSSNGHSSGHFLVTRAMRMSCSMHMEQFITPSENTTHHKRFQTSGGKHSISTVMNPVIELTGVHLNANRCPYRDWASRSIHTQQVL